MFKTSDGGKTWKKVLFVSDHTGASDLVHGRRQPQGAVRRHVAGGTPSLEHGGRRYRERHLALPDGGDTWKKLSKDLPDGDLGRIAVAVAPSNPNRVYALIEAKRSEGLLWSSNDMGDELEQDQQQPQPGRTPLLLLTHAGVAG